MGVHGRGHEPKLVRTTTLAVRAGPGHAGAPGFAGTGRYFGGDQDPVERLRRRAARRECGLFARTHVTSSYRTQLFLVVLALATASVTLRLNLLFTARINPSILAHHHRRLFLWILAAEVGIAILLLGFGMTIAEGHPATAGVVIGLAMVMLISIALIEPATTAAARINRPDSL